MKSHFCMPTRMRPSRKNTRLSPMSLLDRFREAVFRLIMISALSRASTTTAYTSGSTSAYASPSPIRLSSRSSSKSSPAATTRHHHRSYHHYISDSHQTEAVADCIEFIKRSANDENRDSIASNASSNSSSRSPLYGKNSEIVIPLPVM